MILRRRRASRPIGFVLSTVLILVGVPTHAWGVSNSPHPVVVSADPVDWTPHVLDGRISALLPVGGRIIAAGQFTQVQAADGGPVIAKDNIFAFDATTGEIDPTFDASIVGNEVADLALGPDGNIFAGGAFNEVNGQTVRRLVKLDAVTGARITQFASQPSARVNALAVVGDRLYVGGRFSTIKGQPRELLAAVDVTTGDVDPAFDLPVTESRSAQGAPAFVTNVEASPDGSKLIVLGNFRRIDGLLRVQAGMIDLTTSPPSVRDWSTDGFAPQCLSAFDTYMRGADFSPDGEYFVIVTTGAYHAQTLCDTASRWPTEATGSSLEPTWVAYSGGDTLTSVAITGTAVYVGGHQRWMNNPFLGDAPGPGAVPRDGIAALDPDNGVPFSWNPGRARGVGVFAMVATPAGLWIGSDTDRVAGELHQKLAFFPVEGGTAVPTIEPFHLPVDLYNLTANACAGPDQSVLHRVNAGGPQIPAVDCGPNWLADADDTDPGASFRNIGSNAASWNENFTVRYDPAGPVPITTPRAVYATERWDPSGAPELSWDFPVAAGMAIEVRLYFANGFDGTAQAGTRVFHVDLDGTQVLSNYDISAEVGHRSGTMHAFPATSDGNVDIDLSHVQENPLINAIEIVRTDVSPGPFPSCPGTDPSILHRVNAGGPAVPAVDCGATWLADDNDSAPGATFRNSGSNSALWNQPFAVQYEPDGPVPASTPSSVYLSERWDPGGPPEMSWNFLVPAGTPIQVRLYLINQCSCTGPGATTRQFDVRIDDDLVLDDYNLIPDVGDRTGTVKAFDVTSDGNVDIDFAHVSENPLVNAIEIVRTDVDPLTPTPTEFLEKRTFDGSTAGPVESLPTPGIDWTNVRSAFALGSFVYLAWGDGRMTVRPFSGNAFGNEQAINLFGLTNFPLGSVTGMFFANHGIYYTVEGDSRMFYRYFTAESRIVGAEVWAVSGNGDGLDWSDTRGLSMLDGSLYFARSDGDLRAMSFSGGAPVQGGFAPVPGTETVIRPATDGYHWASKALFAFEPVALDTDPPTTPAKPVGLSSSVGEITLSWQPSTDDNPPITYRVFRDGQPVPIAEVNGTSFTDVDLTPGSTHTYALQAYDALGNESGIGPASDPILVDSAFFADDFSTGDFSLWTDASAAFSIDDTAGDPAPPSALASVSNQAANIGVNVDPLEESCLSFRVNVSSRSGGMVLARLRTTDSGPILRVLVRSSGELRLRSDFASTTLPSGVDLEPGWHKLELCGVVGSAGLWSLYLDDSQIITDWEVDVGEEPVGRIEIGSPNSQTWTAHFDDVRVDDTPGEFATPDETPPTVPGQPSGSSPTAGTIQIDWAPSTDDSPPITYRVYRDGGGTPVGQTTTTSFTDEGLTPGATHTYAVDAVDFAGNESARSAPSDPIEVADETAAIFADDFSTGDFALWDDVTNLTIDNGVGLPSPPSAFGDPSGQRAFAERDLGATFDDLCVSLRVNITARSTTMALLRLRTADGGPIVRVFVNNNDVLVVRSDVASANLNSGVELPSGWHQIELCGSVGPPGSWDLYLDGGLIVDGWQVDSGTDSIGAVQVGAPASGTWTANLDDVVVDAQPG